MKILVFGKTGQVATELQRHSDQVIALGHLDADFMDPDACVAALKEHNVGAVINAAAYTSVDKAEDEIERASRINGETPGALARTCSEMNTPFIHISTDYVFSGHGDKVWHPDDPTDPINAYGQSKLLGEKMVRAAGGNHAILRTSWVFSKHGTNFVKTMLKISEMRDSLNIVEDQIGGPTSAESIAKATLIMAKAMAGGGQGGIYHFSGTPNTSWADFARTIFYKAGHQVDVCGIPTSDYPTPARRPMNSRLDCDTLKKDFSIDRPDWVADLETVLTELHK